MRRNYERLLQEKFGDPIGKYAGSAMVGVRDEGGAETCPDCGMLPIEGRCGCAIETAGDDWYKSTPDSGPVCRACREEMSTNTGCGCNRMSEGTEPCAECGMYEVEGTCGCTHNEGDSLDEVTPPGKEKMVKALKKDPEIDNPWAVAWAAYNKEK